MTTVMVQLQEAFDPFDEGNHLARGIAFFVNIEVAIDFADLLDQFAGRGGTFPSGAIGGGPGSIQLRDMNSNADVTAIAPSPVDLLCNPVRGGVAPVALHTVDLNNDRHTSSYPEEELVRTGNEVVPGG